MIFMTLSRAYCCCEPFAQGNNGQDRRKPRSYRQDAGIADKNQLLITYCNTGRASTVNYLVLRSLGYENVRMYDGSLSEWVANGKPIATGPAE